MIHSCHYRLTPESKVSIFEAPHQEMTRSNQIQLSTLRTPSPAAYTQDSFSIQNAKAGRLTNAQRKGDDVCTESQSVSCRGIEAVHRALAKTEGKCLNRVGKGSPGRRGLQLWMDSMRTYRSYLKGCGTRIERIDGRSSLTRSYTDNPVLHLGCGICSGHRHNRSHHHNTDENHASV